MSLRRAPRPVADSASATQTQTNTGAAERDGTSRHIGTLRLRGEPRPRPGVRWAEGVVDNSNLNRKKSKVCCIYHKPRDFGESSSDSSSSDSSESDGLDTDSEPDNSKARMGGKGAARRKRGHRHDCDHDHGEHDHDHGGAEESSASDDERDAGKRPSDASSRRPRRGQRSVRKRSPNAYEKMKTYKRGSGGTGTMTQRES